MYQDVKRIKAVIAKTKIDHYTNERLELPIRYAGGQRETAIRQLLELGLDKWHELNTVGMKPIQQDFINDQTGT